MCGFEMVAILNTKADENALTIKLEEMLKENGAEITLKEIWGERLLAYKVKGQTKGKFIVIDFSLEFDKVEKIEDYLNNNENIIKHIIVKKS